MRRVLGARFATTLVAAACALTVAACGEDEEQGAVTGEGYAFDLPEAWSDSTDRAEDLGEEVAGDIPAGDLGTQYDSLATDEPVDGFATNVNVIVQGSLAGEIDSRRFVESSRRVFTDPALSSQFLPTSVEVTGGPTEMAETDVGGVSGYSFDVETEAADRQLTQRFVGVVNDGSAYAITFTALADEFDSEVADLESILDGWTWDG